MSRRSHPLATTLLVSATLLLGCGEESSTESEESALGIEDHTERDAGSSSREPGGSSVDDADDSAADIDDDTTPEPDDAPGDDTATGPEDDEPADDDVVNEPEPEPDDDPVSAPEPEPAPGDDKPTPVGVENPLTDPSEGPPAGNPEGRCEIPAEAGPEDTSVPDHVVGNGTSASCTGEAFIEAVARGGIITFDCGPDPVTITLEQPAKVFNNASDVVVIDGGGLVTLSGGGTTRILYMNTCDENQVWTTPNCDNQDHPRLTLQNLTFTDANSRNEEEYDGGGAIWARGGRLKIVHSRFFNNVCADSGADVGGAGVRVFDQYEDLPVYVTGSTFGGAEGYGNTCSNGGGISSIGVSWTILNSVFSHNRAIGNGGNPAQDGTPGGGSGGGIYNDGNTMTLSICGTRIENNQVRAFGSGIFFVSNNHDGTLRLEDTTIRNNTGGDWNVLPGVSMHEDTEQLIENSVLE